MKKILILFLFLALSFQVANSQGLTSTDIFTSFKYRMKSDNLVFPDSVIYQLINSGTGMACIYGFAYPKVDTLVLSTGTEEYGLTEVAIWVYKVGKINVGERAWQRVGLENFGKYEMKEALNPAYYDFTTVMADVDSEFSAGNDTSYIYVYPKPTSADNNDSLFVHYFAWIDSIDGNLKNITQDLVLELALMVGYVRKGRTDKMVEAWNEAGIQMNLLTNYWLQRLYNIEVVPKSVGGR